MAMPNKRLEYEPLKAVLQSLEPNLRIKLALRIPSIRIVEKIVPIKIDNLASGNHKVVINDTTYKLGIYRQYHIPAQTPRYHQKHNQEGGFGYDIDRWGFLTNPFDDPIADGDIDLKQTGELWGPEEHPGVEQWYTGTLVIHQEALRRLAKRNGEFHEPNFVIPEIPNIPNSELIISQNEDKVLRCLESTIESLLATLDFARCEFLRYYYRKHNISPPYIPMTHLTISSLKGKVIERVYYSKKLCDASKYLNTSLFGARRHPIQVKELSFVVDTFAHRLPKGLKIQTRQIRSQSVNFEKLKDLVVPASYPLEIVTIQSGIGNADNFEHDMVKSAKKLVISNYSSENESWIPIVQNLRNQSIVLKYQTELHVPQDYITLIEHWLESERTRGANLSIGFRQQETVMDLLSFIKSQFEVIEMSERSLTLPMENGSRLLITCEQAEVDIEEYKNIAGFCSVGDDSKTHWVLKLIVV